MSAHKNNDINLLPQKGFESTTTGRLVGWFLGTFRLILIVTEMIVMAAFFSRFYLDARNTDLSEAIQQKKAVIESYAKTEREFRSAQNKLTLLSQLDKSATVKTQLLDSIRTSLPNDSVELSLDNIQISDTSIMLNGIALTEKSILQFISNLDNSNLISNVALQSISHNGNNAYLVFTLTISVENLNQVTM
jgi:Tfp pilus assembly protein PilN